MATYTTGLNLKKPATSDGINIADFNNNFDLIDVAVAGGWIALPAMTRESDFAFSCAVNLTSILQKGYRIRYKQGVDWKYQAVINVGAYSGGKTIITTMGGNIYTSGIPITDAYYSPSESPLGWPEWFSWVPIVTGFSGTPSVVGARYKISGGQCFVYFLSISGISNTTAFTFTLPVACPNEMRAAAFVGVRDNGADQPVPGHIRLNGTNIAEVYKSYYMGAWTASGQKATWLGVFSYPF
jgi:hypothetical protein